VKLLLAALAAVTVAASITPALAQPYERDRHYREGAREREREREWRREHFRELRRARDRQWRGYYWHGRYWPHRRWECRMRYDRRVCDWRYW
jgi:hypothetical protein